MVGTDSRNIQQLRRRVACILSAAWPDCTHMPKNPLLAFRMVVPPLDFHVPFSLRSLFGFDAQVSAKCVVVVVVVVSHIQRIGCQSEKTTLHGGQSRSWSAEQGMRRRVEVTVSVSIFLVCMLERGHKRNPSLVLIGSG